MEKYLVKCENAGVFYGEVTSCTLGEVHMRNVRQIWSWEGADSLMQMANIDNLSTFKCKMTMKVDSIILCGAVLVIKCSDEAISKLDSIPVWKF